MTNLVAQRWSARGRGDVSRRSGVKKARRGWEKARWRVEVLGGDVHSEGCVEVEEGQARRRGELVDWSIEAGGGRSRSETLGERGAPVDDAGGRGEWPSVVGGLVALATVRVERADGASVCLERGQFAESGRVQQEESSVGLPLFSPRVTSTARTSSMAAVGRFSSSNGRSKRENEALRSNMDEGWPKCSKNGEQ